MRNFVTWINDELQLILKIFWVFAKRCTNGIPERHFDNEPQCICYTIRVLE